MINGERPDKGERRRKLIREAYQQITARGHAVCVCGQLFLTEDGYAQHVPQCALVARLVAVE